jgi:hypothetical protein
MQNYREFQAGPDPFGRQYRVLFKWLQTAISLRHADTVDVKFILTDDSGLKSEKTIALPHAELLRVSTAMARKMDDPWCARLAQAHLLNLISTGEDMEKDLVTVGYADLMRYAGELAREEKAALPAG